MKKILITAVISLFAWSQAEAQVSFRPGVRGGVNFSHFTKGDSFQNYYIDNNGNYVSTNSRREFNSKTDFYLGIYGALKLTKMYTLQPEIDYSRQGATIDAPGGVDNKLEVSYLSVAVVNKFTFNKFNIHLGPTVDFVVENDFDTDSDIDLAFQLGAGYDFTKNFGIEARVKKGVIPVLDFSDSNHTNVVFSVGATYTFDVK